MSLKSARKSPQIGLATFSKTLYYCDEKDNKQTVGGGAEVAAEGVLALDADGVQVGRGRGRLRFLGPGLHRLLHHVQAAREDGV